ncbi:MAG TPA: hypothetical protein DCR97_01725 [Deltaproteobacteria bacterium]|nr:hypothetical protein [Deltaproteobacteria bacterium]
MRLYHRTFAGREILRDGFKDAGESHGVSDDATGVWVCDAPSTGRGDTLLTIEVPDDAIAQYEWVEKGKTYREFLVPAKVLNRYGPPVIAMEQED